MHNAQLAISYAEQEQIAEFAAPELEVARERLSAAHSEVAMGEMLLAERLAEQASAEAELALARERLAVAQSASYELFNSNMGEQQ
ncbi:DUF4398 domain-containing protein [Pseudomonas sp. PDM16]|uniref:DUF4398 domain-containing protein n=1 Tax=Pseudomonas sp. PDM16 TaxID=2769292 RepID=UPI00178520B4|nr:DUF4398 domain-containing protein [Pseudomonas sp. PDM16]MBD9416974.1 DUF4398 domain-containing protein [Pseudomonas sp. PDM16]